MQDNKSQHFILDHLIKYQMSFCHAALSVFIRPQFAKIAIAPQISKTQNGSQNVKKPRIFAHESMIVSGRFLLYIFYSVFVKK